MDREIIAMAFALVLSVFSIIGFLFEISIIKEMWDELKKIKQRLGIK